MTRFDRVFVWSGGALFVLSLAACAYVYVVVWASPAAAAGWQPGARSPIDAVLFAVFALHHSLFARESIKRAGRARRARPAAPILLRLDRERCSCSSCSRCGNRSVATSIAVTGWRAVVHAAVQLGGVWLIARSVARIDPLELAGIRPAARQRRAANRGPVPMGAAPAVPRMAAGRVRRGAHDRRSPRVCRDQHRLSAAWRFRGRSDRCCAIFGEPYARYQRTVRWRVVPYVY